MASETQLWNRLRAALRGVRGLHMVRVENGIEAGTPDVNYALYQTEANGSWFDQTFRKCFEGWIELKVVDPPTRAFTAFELGLSEDQVRWHTQRLSVGGCVATLAQVGAQYWWAPGAGAFGRQDMVGWLESDELRIYERLEAAWLLEEMARVPDRQ